MRARGRHGARNGEEEGKGEGKKKRKSAGKRKRWTKHGASTLLVEPWPFILPSPLVSHYRSAAKRSKDRSPSRIGSRKWRISLRVQISSPPCVSLPLSNSLLEEEEVVTRRDSTPRLERARNDYSIPDGPLSIFVRLVNTGQGHGWIEAATNFVSVSTPGSTTHHHHHLLLSSSFSRARFFRTIFYYR